MNKVQRNSEENQSDQNRSINVSQRKTEESSLYTEGFSTSFYTSPSVKTPILSDQTADQMSSQANMVSSNKSSIDSNHFPIGAIKLMPVKLKDVVNIFTNTAQYNVQNPEVIKMNKNDIDKMIRKHEKILTNGGSYSPQQSFQLASNISPITAQRSLSNEQKSQQLRRNSPIRDTSHELKSKRSYIKSNDDVPSAYKRLLGTSDKNQQVFAMPDIEAFPMIGSSGFRANKERRPRYKKLKRIRSQTARPRTHSRPRMRPVRISRSRSVRRKSRPRKIIVHSRKRSPVIIKRKIRQPVHYIDPPCCTPYPLCDNDCLETSTRPIFRNEPRHIIGEEEFARKKRLRDLTTTSRPFIRPIGQPDLCCCEPEDNKLQFIQPGVCSKKRNFWTNEYAIIPKPQVNLIDPCEDLDPTIYPRANNPCIRDRRGNPLTDCIGRPLRDPTGKKFLKFSPNGSILDTNFRGNFYTGQPPLCVKCLLPDCSCGPDMTHNWWMNCGYPILPDMSPFFKEVVRGENRKSW